MLSSEQVNQAITQIDALSDLWEQRHLELPFFTLGAASYLDSSKVNKARYYRKAAKLNPCIKSEFDWLYSILLKTLEQATGHTCVLADGQALPGFHIFKSHQQFLEPIASKHIDLQYQSLDWEDQDTIDFENNTISFTLALELPTSGAGLNIWPHTEEDLDRFPPLMNGLMSYNEHEHEHEHEHDHGDNGQYVAYQTGHLALHSGCLLHQIAPIKSFQPNERRITLQGHGVLKNNNQFLLYW